ncbi:LPS assembly lipoprotein LptE [candidate division KSB1 bacterium]|nr:LPS assembly lipoprotein LptE [candidate division KSB1 bacterium]
MISLFKKYWFEFLVLSAVLLVNWGCGYYSFSGSLPPHLKSIAIPLFDDRSAEFGIKEELTDQLIEKFAKDNSLKITDRNAADLILEGTITAIRDLTGGFDRQENVQNMKVNVTVHIKCTDTKKRKVMWEESITRWGNFEPGSLDSRRQGITDAVQQIADEILNKTVAGW